MLEKPVIQIILDINAGCFFQKDKSKNESYISEERIKAKTLFNRESQSFKIQYIDEDWLVGYLCKPNKIYDTIQLVLKEPKRYEQNRKY